MSECTVRERTLTLTLAGTGTSDSRLAKSLQSARAERAELRNIANIADSGEYKYKIYFWVLENLCQLYMYCIIRLW